jgi:hypothetical protein
MTDEFRPAGHGPEDDGVGDDVTLTVGTQYGPILHLPLVHAAITARANTGTVLPFLYRDPYDPDDPDKPRPLRSARLVIVEDQA